MKISELFYSIQGEGKRAGTPSFFIRTNYCNLRCQFTSGNLCDTPYTSWFPDNDDNIGDVHISDIIHEYAKYKCKDVVITGGEPTMFPHELKFLIESLKAENPDVFITLETNGTYYSDFLTMIDLISVSPKLKSSIPYKTSYEKMHEKSRVNAEALYRISLLKKNNFTDVQWKFVYTGNGDLEEIMMIKSDLQIPASDIYLMPEGISKQDLDQTRLMTIEACIKNGFNFSDRLHILAWGNQRGV
ncbi:MAG TPA: 7-carboxy-7-deazaguanine synthase QueE [Ignavibacteria bacterium]|nr:7-carboxy-7-deazaguanine synthase QueE [Ignavibacteria bacterium]